MATLALPWTLACGEIYPMAEGPRVELSPAELRVATSTEGTSPGPQIFYIRSSGRGTFAVPSLSIHYAEPVAAWASATFEDTAPDGALEVALHVNTGSQLPAGTYHATVVVAPPNPLDGPLALPVTLEVGP